MLRILMVEDVATEAELASRELKRARIEHSWRRVDTLEGLEREIEEFDPDLIISDFSLPRFSGLEALEAAQRLRPDIPFLFLSGTIGEETAIESLKKGAVDYVLKTNPRRLASATQRALDEARQRDSRRRLEADLKASEVRFRTLSNSAPIGIVLLGLAGQTVYANRRWHEITESNSELTLKMGWAHALHSEDREQVSRELLAASAAGRAYQGEFRAVTQSGRTLWIDGHFVPEREPTGAIVGTIGTIADITERVLAQQRIARLSRIRALLGAINAAIVRIVERGELYREACRVAAEHGGFALAWIGLIDPATGELAPLADGRTILPGSPRASGAAHDQSVIGRALRAGQAVFSNDIAADASMGDWHDTLLSRGLHSMVALPLACGGQAIGALMLHSRERGHFNEEEEKLMNELAADLSFALDHIEKSERLNYLAYYDPLTGLPNRALFTDRFGQLIKDARRERRTLGVVALDLQRFRLINDTLGRHAGDTLLQQVAARLAQYSGSNDRLARVSGDLFAVMIADAVSGPALAGRLERNIARWVAEPFTIAGQEIRVAARIGVALYPSDGDDAETLFGNAETALKQARGSGSRLVFYAPAMNARVAERLNLENRLRGAIHTGQFVLHYQPKVDLASGRIDGLEALIRWRDPERGMVQPGAFIPLLEETGMIFDVGMWAVRQALADYQRLRGQTATPPRIAVNVSPLQLRHRDFVREIQTALGSAAGGAHGLDLEITESVVMEDIAANIVKLQAIRAMDVGVAVDDFGTGYSSLSYIARLPINALKIDRSFITHMAERGDDRAIVASVISLAHALNLKVIAEGVETAQQAEMLRSLACDQAQGFLFARPMPLEDLLPLLGLPSAGPGKD